MVTTKPTQSPQGASDDSVRITAQQRHDAVVGFLSTELVRQQSIVAFEKRDRTAKRRAGVAPVDMDAADMRVTAAVAVLCVHSTAEGNCGERIHRYMAERDDNPIVGFIPGTPAAEKAVSR
jgi:hypothetical protein